MGSPEEERTGGLTASGTSKGKSDDDYTHCHSVIKEQSNRPVGFNFSLHFVSSFQSLSVNVCARLLAPLSAPWSRQLFLSICFPLALVLLRCNRIAIRHEDW